MRDFGSIQGWRQHEIMSTPNPSRASRVFFRRHSKDRQGRPSEVKRPGEDIVRGLSNQNKLVGAVGANLC